MFKDITYNLNYLEVYFIFHEDSGFLKFISKKAHLLQNKFNLPVQLVFRKIQISWNIHS